MVEADCVNASIQHLWTIFDRLPYKGVQAESSKALRTPITLSATPLLIYIASAIVTGILMFIFLPQSHRWRSPAWSWRSSSLQWHCWFTRSST